MGKIFTVKSVLTRRSLIKAAGLTATLPMPTIWSAAAHAQNRVLTIRDPGGAWRAALSNAYYAPFTAETGVRVNAVVAEHDPTAQVKAQVDTKNYLWNACMLTLAAHAVLPANEYFEPLDLSGPDVAELIPQAKQPTWMGNSVYATILAYDAKKFGSDKPTSWADFWDVKRFPGRRGMRRHALDTFEPTLLADGVAADKLFPLDIPRALRKLDAIKTNIDVWWTGGAQSSQLLETREVDLCVMWNGRAQDIIDANASYQIMWNQGIWGIDGWCIPKGNPQAALAKEFVKFVANAKRQAEFSKRMAYGPVNPKAFAHIEKARALVLPTNPDYFPSMVLQDPVGWGPAKDKALEAFDAWLIKK